MDLASLLNIQLPITDPTWIFFLVLSIILFAPMLFERLRIPSIIGLILAGLIIGNHGFNILNKDSSFELFGKVGLYYIMFLAGLEMNMSDVRKNQGKIIVYGTLTFIIPMTLGILSNVSILQYTLITSILLACIYASHTLVTYPIVFKYGLARHKSVSITVGATAITDTLTLLILAIIGGTFKGEISILFWIWMIVKLVLIFFLIIFFFPRITRWFFRHYEDTVTQFVFVLALVFLGAGLMEFVGMEGILGAFLTGLVLNRFIPHLSPLMSHLEFVGNALFIPYFLIGVGMMINLRVFGSTMALKVAGVMIAVALISKWLAVYAYQKIYGLRTVERNLMYGLSNSRAAATLAVVMVGYNIILPNHQRLLNDDILNSTILLILVTCIFSSFTTERASRKLALSKEKLENEPRVDDGPCIVSYANPDTVTSLTQMAMMMNTRSMHKLLLGLNVSVDTVNGTRGRIIGRRCLTEAVKIASAAKVTLTPVERVSTNVITGIIHTMKEYEATELVLGLHRKANIADSYYGTIAESLLKGTHRQIMIIKCLMPPNTLRRIIVAVPPKAEYEVGFYKWVRHLCRMANELECRIQFYAHPTTIPYLEGFINAKYDSVQSEFTTLDSWDDLLLLTGAVNYDHLLVIVSARRGFISYNSSFEALPVQLSKYFNNNSLILLYPEQYGDPLETPPSLFSSKPLKKVNVHLYNRISKWVDNQIKKI